MFLEGSYLPLEFKGEQAHHVCGFMRQHHSHMCVVIFPRLLTNLIPDQTISPLGESIWGQTSMRLHPEFAAHSFRNLLTQEIVTPQNGLSMVGLPVGMLFQHFPFALLEPVS